MLTSSIIHRKQQTQLFLFASTSRRMTTVSKQGACDLCVEMAALGHVSNSSPLPPAVHPLAILYGSETGTAQEVAEYAAGMARRRGFNAQARALDDVTISDIFESDLAVFIVSTTGDGEIPSTMSSFWRFLLRRGLPSDCLQSMRFAVFGLGDSGYAKYNAAARKLHARLLQLGAEELVPRGLGDDQSPKGMWGDLDPWIASLWSSLLKLKPLPLGTTVDDTPRLEPAAFSINSINVGPAESSVAVNGVSYTLKAAIERGKEAFWKSIAPPAGRRNHPGGAPTMARLVTNRRLTEDDHFQDVRHIELDVTGVPGETDYQAGDVVWLHPCNDRFLVEEFARTQRLSLDQIVRVHWTNEPDASASGEGRKGCTQDSGVEENDGTAGAEGNWNRLQGGEHTTIMSASHPQQQQRHQRPFVPPVCSVQFLLREVLDILGTPRRSFFESLSLFASDREEKEKLMELASPDGADLLYEYATREKRSYVEVLGDFPSCKVPLERLLELVPRLRPRGFSIASSSLKTPSRVHLCVAIVMFRTPYKRIRGGICSTWLASLGNGAEVPLCIRPGTFRLPQSPTHPLIMVGPGTGVAPMRSVILERQCQRREIRSGHGLRGSGNDTIKTGTSSSMRGEHTGDATRDTLFFGCRYKEKDFLYGEEWAEMSAQGELSLQTAFSRQNPDPRGGRVYVQHRIREQSGALSRLVVDGGAHVLVSGSAKQMPLDVREAIRDALATHSNVDGQAGAEAMLKTMERTGRYSVEAWS